MEYFASDPRVLQDISQHYQTGEKLGLDTLEKYVASKIVAWLGSKNGGNYLC